MLERDALYDKKYARMLGKSICFIKKSACMLENTAFTHKKDYKYGLDSACTQEKD
jgi:hypothetical protein